jgi:competence protein ComEC
MAVVGILAGERAGPGPAGVVLALGVGSAVASFALRRPGPRLVVGALAVTLVASAVTQRALDGAARSPLRAPTDARAGATVEGALVEDPGGGPYSVRVLLRIARIDGRPAGHRTVVLSGRGDVAARLKLLEAGDRVSLDGWLEPLTGFDERLRWRHAVAHLHAVELHRFAPPTSLLMRTANALRARVLSGGAHLPATERALVAGFLLGDTRALSSAVDEQFRNAGLTHLLAVSGANVAFVLALVAPVLRRLSLRSQLVGGLAVIVLYGTMTRWEPSVLRACVMAACAMTALHLGRPTVGLRTLALAALVLLLADPFLLHSIGFLLSVGASAGIAVFGPRIVEVLPGPAMVREGLGITLAAQIGVAPVLIPVFGSIPVASLPANLLAVPLAAPLTVWGLVSGLAGSVVEPWWPGLAEALQVPTGVLAGLLLRIAEVCSQFTPAVDGRAAVGLVGLTALAAATKWRRSLRGNAPESAR